MTLFPSLDSGTRLAALLPLSSCELTKAESAALIRSHCEELLSSLSPLQSALIRAALRMPDALPQDQIAHCYGVSPQRMVVEHRLAVKQIAQELCRLWVQQPPLPMDDTALLLPVVVDLWRRGQLSNHVYRVFQKASRDDPTFPKTVGELRQVLRVSGKKKLRGIPQIGPVGLAQLRTLFFEHEQIIEEEMIEPID